MRIQALQNLAHVVCILLIIIMQTKFVFELRISWFCSKHVSTTWTISSLPEKEKVANLTPLLSWSVSCMTQNLV